MLPVSRNLGSNFLDEFLSIFSNGVLPRVNTTAPAVNVKENDKQYEMEVAAPGLKKEYARVQLDADGNLNIKIEDKFEHKEEDKKEHYLRREFSYGNYEQTYTLPEDVDTANITANVADGVLHVILPKTVKEEKKEGQRIEIQ